MNSALKQYITKNTLKAARQLQSHLTLPPATLRLTLDQLCKIFPIAQNIEIKKINIAGVHTEQLKAANASQKIILHIHGGAFFLGSLNTHRAFMSKIAAQTLQRVIHIHYPLAPEARYPEALDAAYDVYQQLINEGNRAKDIIISGDSCGANLALALALKIKTENTSRLPSGLILLSPFLDLTLSSASLHDNQKYDVLLSAQLLKTGISYSLPPEIDRTSPLVSPLFADLTGLPPTLVQVGSKEILFDDATRFEEKAKLAGVKVSFKSYTGMWHNFQMFSAWFDEAKLAIRDLAEFTNQLNKP